MPEFFWQNPRSGALRHTAFGAFVFAAADVAERGVIEIGAVTKRVQLLALHDIQSLTDFFISIETASVVDSSDQIHTDAQMSQFGPSARTSTLEVGTSLTAFDAGDLADRFRVIVDSNGVRESDHLVGQVFPIIAEAGEFIRIAARDIDVIVAASVAWVEF